MAMDRDSIVVLEAVKRGAAARFVLSTKGNKVLALVVYRIGTQDTAEREAKKSGPGELACGVVESGGGVNLVFKLAASDGFEKPPTRDLILREFLGASQVEAKPTIQIVEQLPELPDEAPPLDSPGRIMPRLPLTPPQQQNRTPPQLPPRPNAPPTPRNDSPPPTPRPQTPPPQHAPPLNPQQQAQQQAQQLARQKAAEERAAREAVGEHSARKVAELNATPGIHPIQRLKDIRDECEADAESDFGAVVAAMVMRPKPENNSVHDYRAIVMRLANARELAKKYVRSHQNPLVGKLPARVVKRRQYCEQFLKEIDAYAENVRRRNEEAVVLCDNYQALIKSARPVPYRTAEELMKLRNNNWLSPETQAKIEQTIDLISQTNKAQGYGLLSRSPNLTDDQRALVMLDYGCHKSTPGGSSDIKLLTTADGTIVNAFKSVDGESGIGLNVLGLPPGASTLREDLCSTINQAIREATGWDMGFPQTKVIRSQGRPGALIEGLRGETADPDELVTFTRPDVLEVIGQQKADEEYAKVRQRLATLPDQVTAESLQDVVFASVLTVQWDAKWGNMMIDNGRARPIDGGTAFPTKVAVDRFVGFGGLGISNLLRKPSGDHGPLAQAQVNLDAEKVAAILKLDADALVQKAKDRRAELLQEHPEFDGAMLDDGTLNVMKASIEGAQRILRGAPAMTLEQFVTAYEQWFLDWSATL